MRVQNFGAVTAIKSLNIGILVRLARLNITNLDAVCFTLLRKGQRCHFTTVIHPNHFGQASFCFKLLHPSSIVKILSY